MREYNARFLTFAHAALPLRCEIADLQGYDAGRSKIIEHPLAIELISGLDRSSNNLLEPLVILVSFVQK
jgi:hypothetical protein